MVWKGTLVTTLILHLISLAGMCFILQNFIKLSSNFGASSKRINVNIKRYISLTMSIVVPAYCIQIC